jgi:hypothetical protein
MAIELNVDLVKKQMKRAGIGPVEMSALLGYTTRQGFYYMMDSRSLKKINKLSEIFGIDKNAFVIIS